MYIVLLDHYESVKTWIFAYIASRLCYLIIGGNAPAVRLRMDRYVDECYVWIINIDTCVLSLTYTLMCYTFDKDSIFEMPVYKTLSCKMGVRVRACAC